MNVTQNFKCLNNPVFLWPPPPPPTHNKKGTRTGLLQLRGSWDVDFQGSNQLPPGPNGGRARGNARLSVLQRSAPEAQCSGGGVDERLEAAVSALSNIEASGGSYATENSGWGPGSPERAAQPSPLPSLPSPDNLDLRPRDPQREPQEREHEPRHGEAALEVLPRDGPRQGDGQGRGKARAPDPKDDQQVQALDELDAPPDRAARGRGGPQPSVELLGDLAVQDGEHLGVARVLEEVREEVGPDGRVRPGGDGVVRVDIARGLRLGWHRRGGLYVDQLAGVRLELVM